MSDSAPALDRHPLPSARRFALFEYGFRPFFLLAGAYALVMVPAWLYFYGHHATSFGALPTMYWHAHEMLYGFVCAAIAGFLLTAVPSWTGARGFAGPPLIVLVALWFAGRIAMAPIAMVMPGDLPFWLTAVLELSFLPAVAVLLIPPLVRSRNRNTPLLAVLGVLWLIDIALMFAMRSGDVAIAARATALSIDFVLILVTVIGGRIVPSFTANALRRRGETVTITIRPWLERTVIGLMIAIAVADLLWPGRMLSAALAALAAVAQAARLAGWRSFKTRGESILWVLHVGYAWLPIGLALKACWLFGGFVWAMKWQHALTMGVFATMILAVMTRASLGHTGRPLVVVRAMTIAYVSLTAGVLVRVFGMALWPDRYLLTVTTAGVLWTLCFLIYVVVYAPILIGPRADGKPG